MRHIEIALLVTALCLTAGCANQGSREAKGPRGEGGPGASPRPVAVELATVKPATLADRLELTGTLEAARQVDVAARTAGRLASVEVDLGDAVRAGQVIARLDDADLRARLAQADAALASQRASLGAREVERAAARRDLARDQGLYRQSFIARQELEATQARVQTADAMVALARAELLRQQAAVREASVAAEQTRVTAPMAGTVGERHLDPGAMAGPAQPIVTLVTPGDLKARVRVSEQVLPHLSKGAAASLKVDAWPSETFPATVTRVAPLVAADTHTAEVELLAHDPAHHLRPGMFARVGLTLSERKNVPTVPRLAVVKREGQDGVYVAEGETARFVSVTLGLAQGAEVELTAGPAVGTKVVTLGNTLLKDGSPLRLAEAGPGFHKGAGQHRRQAP